MKLNHHPLIMTSLLVLSFWICIAHQNVASKNKVITELQIAPIDTFAQDPGVSFQKDVIPIIKTKCNMVDCHGEKGFPKFYTYKMLRAKAKKIKKRIVAKVEPMPPKDSPLQLTKEEINILNAWVDAGAPNN